MTVVPLFVFAASGQRGRRGQGAAHKIRLTGPAATKQQL